MSPRTNEVHFCRHCGVTTRGSVDAFMRYHRRLDGRRCMKARDEMARNERRLHVWLSPQRRRAA